MTPPSGLLSLAVGTLVSFLNLICGGSCAGDVPAGIEGSVLRKAGARPDQHCCGLARSD